MLADSGIVTSLLAAYLADTYGRRLTLRSGAFVFTIGGAVQTFCNGYGTMVVGRIISGFGVGMLSMIVPIYQSEISPADHVRRARSPRWTWTDGPVARTARIC